MQALFAAWRTEILCHSDHFVEDGVVSQEHWETAKRKVLFVLKETNDLRRSISETVLEAATVRPKSAVWDRPTSHNVGRWTYGLTNDLTSDYTSAHAGRRQAVLSCALINVKKTTGGRAATIEVEQHARWYAHFLRQQIEIIAPDVIVFGGTYQIVKDHVLPELTKVAPRVHTYGKIVCINANHPACSKPRLEMFNQVVDRYRSYLAHQDALVGSDKAVCGSLGSRRPMV